MKSLRTALIAAALLASGSAQAATTFTDGSLSDFTQATLFTNTAGLTIDTTGPALELTITQPGTATAGSTVLAVGLVESLFTYDPATQGKIDAINASVLKDFSANVSDAVVSPGAPFTFNNTFRPLIEQGGQFYSGFFVSPTSLVAPAGSGSTTGAHSIGGTGLTASSFSLFDPATGAFNAAVHPDFSSSGSALTFGLFQVLGSTNPESSTVIADYSNYKVTVFSAVPENASWEMMIGGFGLIGGLMRRRGRLVVS